MKVKDLYSAGQCNEGAEVRILDGLGKPTSLYIKIRGIDSKVVRDHNKIQRKAYIEALRTNSTYEEDELLIQGLVKATISWRGTDDKFTKEACEELYREAPFIAEQLDEFIAERANFTKAKRKK